MRIAIISGSLPAATRIYNEVASVTGFQVFVVLCLHTNRSWFHRIAKQAVLLILRRPRWRTLRLVLAGRVCLMTKPLDHPETVARLERMQLDVGLHDVGVIYRDATIKAFRLGILNPHIGLLPQYRGRSVMEWSLLNGDPTGISVFFIDEGIDTGERIVLTELVDVSHCRSVQEAKDYLFSLNAEYFRLALEQLRTPEFSYKWNDDSGKRYYVMSALFHDVIDQALKTNQLESHADPQSETV